MKHLDLQNLPPAPVNGRTAPPIVPAPTADQDGHARTHAMLATLSEKIEELSAVTPPHGGATPLARFLGNPLSALIGFVSDLGGLWTVLVTVGVVLLKLKPTLPQAANSLTGILIPFATLTATAVAVAFAGRWIRHKSQRIRFLAWMMGSYSLATAAYLFWLSTGFLHSNTLPSGVLLATCVYGTISILQKTLPDVREMLALAETKARKENR